MAVRVPARRRISVPPTALAYASIVALGLAAAAGAIALAGTKTGAVLALLATLGPLCAYGTLTAPLLFPFSAFILLVPFDNILAFSTFGTVTKLVAGVSGAALVLYLLRTKRLVSPDRALWWWGIFFLWALSSLTWAIDAPYAFAHMFTLAELLLLYGAVSVMPVDQRTLRVLVGTVILSATIASLYGIYLFHSGTDVSSNGRLFIANDENLIDPNQFAAALVLPFALSLMGVAASRTMIGRIASLAALIAIGGGIAVAGSRGAILALAATFVYLVVRSRHRFTIAGLGVAAIGVVLGLYANVLTRFSNAASTGGAGRADIWKVGVAAFRHHPIVGSGFSNFPLAYDRAFLDISESYYTRWHRAPHNLAIEIGVELGIIGLLLVAAAAYAQFKSLRIVPPTSDLYSLRTALEATLLGLAVASIFLDMLMTKYLWLAFMLIMLTRNAEYCTSRPRRVDTRS